MKDADGLSEWYSCMRASHCTLLLRVCTITDVYVWAQTTAVFVRFLREASTFYALLTSKLQAPCQIWRGIDFGCLMLLSWFLAGMKRWQ